MPGASLKRCPSGGPCGAIAVGRLGEDGIDQQGDGVVSAGWPLAAVRAAGIGGDVVTDQGEHGGERDLVRIDAGAGGGAGGDRGGHVVHEQQCPGFLAGEGGRASAQDAAGALDGFLQVQVGDFDGLITNGKFCCVRRVQLSLTWWRRPLRLRRSALHTDVALVGEPDDPDLDRLPPVQPAPGRRAPVGSGLPVAGASGRAGRPARPDADR